MNRKSLLSVILIIYGLFFLFNCSSTERINPPLVIVIKFQAAESIGHIEEALKFIDANKFFSGNKTIYHSRKEWEDLVFFNNSMGKSTKFTNVFKYYNYDIVEQNDANKAALFFNSIDKEAKIKTIIYKLELIQGVWKIVGLQYILFQ